MYRSERLGTGRFRGGRQLAVDAFEPFEVGPVLAAVGEALEGDDAAQAGDARPLALEVDLDRLLGDRVVVQSGKAAAKDVDDAVAAADAQVLGALLMATQLPIVCKAVAPARSRKRDTASSALAPSGTSGSVSLVARRKPWAMTASQRNGC